MAQSRIIIQIEPYHFNKSLSLVQPPPPISEHMSQPNRLPRESHTILMNKTRQANTASPIITPNNKLNIMLLLF